MANYEAEEANGRKKSNIGLDFSTVSSNFAYIVALDLKNSVLQPTAGQKQRFCYSITFNGAKGRYADKSLQNVVFALGREVAAQIEAVWTGGTPGTAAMSGVHTEDAELWIDVGACGAAPSISVGFTLIEPFPVGPVAIRLLRADVPSPSLRICGPVRAQDALPGCDV